LQKKIAKYLERIKKRFYFALAFENYGSRECFKKSSAKYFQKKTSAKVWMLQKNALPLHHFPLRKMVESDNRSSEDTGYSSLKKLSS